MWRARLYTDRGLQRAAGQKAPQTYMHTCTHAHMHTCTRTPSPAKMLTIFLAINYAVPRQKTENGGCVSAAPSQFACLGARRYIALAVTVYACNSGPPTLAPSAPCPITVLLLPPLHRSVLVVGRKGQGWSCRCMCGCSERRMVVAVLVCVPYLGRLVVDSRLSCTPTALRCLPPYARQFHSHHLTSCGTRHTWFADLESQFNGCGRNEQAGDKTTLT
jgi:hypothetical protein